MRRLVRNALLAVGLYAVLFGFLLDRPLSLGPLRAELQQKASRLSRLPSPKLVILAGSNGPYSHSCAVIGQMLGLPCENAGIAVGFGLDEIFNRYDASLRPGDIVYMPMEFSQYVMSAAQYRAFADGEMLLRHDRSALLKLPPGRVAGALFCCTLADALEALVELPLARMNRNRLNREYNAEGDRIDNQLAGADHALLAAAPSSYPFTARDIETGYGTRLIERFISRQRAKGVIVIGGWPVELASIHIRPVTLAAVARIYGVDFLDLANKSRYPSADFFNGPEHLAQPCQFKHSIMVARALGRLLHRAVSPPRPAVSALASTCPG